MHRNVHVIPLAGADVVGRGNGERLLEIRGGAVHPDLCGAVRCDLHITVVLADLVPVILALDNDTEIGVRTVEGDSGDFAPAIGAGELDLLAVQACGGIGIRSPHPQGACLVTRRRLVMDDQTSLAVLVVCFRRTDRTGMIGDGLLDDALGCFVIATAVRIVPAVAAVVEHVLHGIAAGFDGVLPVAARLVVGHRLAGNVGPGFADTVVDVRLLVSVVVLVVHGERGVRGLDGLVLDFDLRVGRVGGRRGCRMAGLGGAAVQGDCRTGRDGGLDLAAGDGHGLGAILGGEHIAVFAVRKRRVVSDVKRLGAVVERQEALGAAREGDAVVAVGLPVFDR